MADAICMGELLIDFVPVTTGTDLLTATAFQKAPGGAPANVAVGLSRLGTSSALMGRASEDGFGRFLIKTLEDSGVDVSLMRRSRRTRTPLAFVSLAEDAEREFLFYGDPSAGFCPEDVDFEAIAKAKLVHFGSIGLIPEASCVATLQAVDAARGQGLHVSFDANLRLDLWPTADSAREAIREGIERATIVKLSDDELDFLTGATDPVEGARGLMHAGTALMVVTHGRHGCTFVTREVAGKASSFKVDPVDTTGAGDAFMAGLLTGLLEHPNAPLTSDLLHAMCLFANAAGALATTQRGGIPGLPHRADVTALVGKGPSGNGPSDNGTTSKEAEG
ncbi:PfkB family carbohydrate kinase [Skermanella rosea]|uniref:PfkB family carbohydrate kinase n=1 Tax=Skermanella rosea TaxID=1817965 RepID=UPI001932ED8E|nr:PfkB family carbohydrate kinase [Skermanella rosea]UEM05568.1 PfkB family carbohydrate kinase [Skermanella rosea]